MGSCVRIELSRRLNRVVPLIDRFCHRLPRRETASPLRGPAF